MDWFTGGIDNSYQALFKMTKQELYGIRHMRAITQLAFEGLIQISIQCSMLYYYQRNPEDETAESLGVDVPTLLISITLCILHGLLELFQLYFEA